MWQHPGEHSGPAVVLSPGATAVEIRYTQNCGFGGFCSLSMQSQRRRPCSENASQCCCASRLSRSADSIGEPRRRAGRSIHALRRATENAVSVRRFIDYARLVKCNRICPSGQVQLLHLVKVARVVSGEKNQSGKVAPRAKGQLPLRLRQCEPDLVLTGLTRLLQIGTDFMDGRAIFIHYYY